jgi:hypothetical protein
MSLIENILAIGLFGIVAVMGARFFGSSIGTQEHIIVRGEVEDVRDLIRSSIDCTKTMLNQAAACGTSQFIEIRKQDNTVLIPNVSPFGVMGGGVEVRSKCSTGDGFYKLDMEYRRVANGAVIKDRMNGKMYDWAPLFESVPVSCPNIACMATTLAVVPTKLDFESIPSAAQGKVVDAAMNTYLRGAYGIRFVPILGGNLQLARVKNQNDSEATFYAWMSALCPGNPKYNRLCNGGNAGQWALSVAGSQSTKDIEFDVYYDFPVNKAEFDLADFDGGETWTVTPYNSAGTVIPGARTFDATGGYGGNSGNNALTHISITTTGSNISRLKIKGHLDLIILQLESHTVRSKYFRIFLCLIHSLT